MSVEGQQPGGSRFSTPFGSVILNDSDPLSGLIDFEVTNSTHFTSDTFKASFAVDQLPATLGIGYWSQASGDELEIFAGFKDVPGQNSKSLIYGQVDEVEIDIIKRTLSLSGRDLSARFIDNKTAEHFQDQTASDVATTLAARRGLTASISPTENWVGEYYELYNLSMTKDQTEWDLLTFLAEQESYDVWVAGKVLFFQPPIPLTTDPYVLEWSDKGDGHRVGNFEDLQMHRSETLARDVLVKVISWHQNQEANVVAEARRNGSQKGQRAGGKAQTYTFYPPNLNKQQADKYAAAKLDAITKQEKVITGKMPGDNFLTNRSLVKLVGTGTSFDQPYFIDSVTRKFSAKDGYGMEFRAKNHSTQSTI